MNRYLADLHIHSVLSPCGNSGMTPRNIILKAKEKGLSIIGISDHNSTLQAAVVKKLGDQHGIYVLCGAEVSTREDIHCLAFFRDLNFLSRFQQYIDTHLMRVQNDPADFGEQLLMDENDMVTGSLDFLLGSSLDEGIDEVEKVIHSLDGLLIPSHINRPRNSLLSQLGYIPDDLRADALEIDRKYYDPAMSTKHPTTQKYTLIRNSDAHYPDSIGLSPSAMFLQKPDFEEITMALRAQNGRRVEIDF